MLFNTLAINLFVQILFPELLKLKYNNNLLFHAHHKIYIIYTYILEYLFIILCSTYMQHTYTHTPRYIDLRIIY